MAMSRIFKTITFLLLFSSTSNADSDLIYYKNEYHNDFKKETKKLYRKYSRFLKSSKIKTQTSKKINATLNHLNSNYDFSDLLYYEFFEFILNLKANKSSENEINKILNFISSGHPNLTLKKIIILLEKSSAFLFDSELNSSKYLKWSYQGESSFEINENGNPIFSLKNSKIFLRSNDNFKSINKVKGYFDIYNNNFNCEFAETLIKNNNLDLNFELLDFVIDLDKKYFSATKSSLVSRYPIRGNFTGTYSLNVNNKSQLPNFNSASKESFIFFDKIKCTGVVNLIDDDFIFTGLSNSPASLSFTDNESVYEFYSNSFKFTKNKIYSKKSEFFISNSNGKLFHPSSSIELDIENMYVNVERCSDSRGLNPFRNYFHGLNIYADLIEIDLLMDKVLFFHKSLGRDVSVLVESNNYFDQSRYNDLLDIDNLILLKTLNFVEDNGLEKYHKIDDFAFFLNKDIKTTTLMIEKMEIFGLVEYYSFTNSFKVKKSAENFINSFSKKYDFDSFKIESICLQGDTLACLDLEINELSIEAIDKIKLSNRFDFQLNIENNKLIFFDDKSFLMNGEINIGNFIFGGQQIKFDYKNFLFEFHKNSIMSFIDKQKKIISSSRIYFDNGYLKIDSCNNKSGLLTINDYPKFKLSKGGFFSYKNKPPCFNLEPFEINYLNDISVFNLSFKGYLNFLVNDSNYVSELRFDDSFNLSTKINDIKSVYIFDNNVEFSGDIDMSILGTKARGKFKSKLLEFSSNELELNSFQIFGKVDSVKSGVSLNETPFFSLKSNLSYFPNDDKFLFNNSVGDIFLYGKYSLRGDVFFDGQFLNGSGSLNSKKSMIESSHHYFSKNSIMSGDSNCKFFNDDTTNLIFDISSASVENFISEDSILIYSSISDFRIPEINHYLNFDCANINFENDYVKFYNSDYQSPGKITVSSRKNKLIYQGEEAIYKWKSKTFNVENVYPIEINNKVFQPYNNYISYSNSIFNYLFTKGTLIKNRRLFKDKLYNGVNLKILPSLKFSLIKA